MCNKTYKELPDFEAFEDKGDLVDDFFGLLTRYMRFQPDILLSTNNLVKKIKLNLKEKQVQMSIIGIGIKEPEPAKAIYQFLEELFRACGKPEPDMKKFPSEKCKHVKNSQ